MAGVKILNVSRNKRIQSFQQSPSLTWLRDEASAVPLMASRSNTDCPTEVW